MKASNRSLPASAFTAFCRISVSAIPKQKTFAKRPFDREYKCRTKFEKVRFPFYVFELISRVAIATFVVLFSTNLFAPTVYAAEGVPDRLCIIQFEYRTDIPVIDSQAHKLDVWIPLPREDGWQR